MKKATVVLLIFVMLGTVIAGCSSFGEAKEDVVKVWTYPVHLNYEPELKALIESFEKENPNVKIEYEVLSWAEGPQKFDIALNSGHPPDIYFGKPQGKYIDTGLAVPIDDKVNVELCDYDSVALDYMRYDNQLYGLPIYMFLHVWGANKQLLEEEGIDYEHIQHNGWTWKEFKELALKGTKEKDGKTQYGFVYQGTNEELLVHLAMNNGLPSRVNENGTTWDGDKILETMQFIRSLIDEGIMPKETAAIDPAKRMELYYNYQALFFGRAIPYYDPIIEQRNKDIESGEKEGKKLNFVLLPIPHKEGEEQVSFGGSEGYMLFTQKDAEDYHLENSIKVLEHLTGPEAGQAAAALALPPVHKDAIGKYEYDMAPYNKKAADVLAGHVLPPADIPVELGTQDDKFREEVVKPTFQALLSGEMTPEEALKTFKEKGEEIFE